MNRPDKIGPNGPYTKPAGGCLGTLFAILVVLYVVFGMLWMFIKEHIGLIAVAAIIIGVLWYRSKMNKRDEEVTDAAFFQYVNKYPNRFFAVVPGNNEPTIYIDIWRGYGYSDDCDVLLAYQAGKDRKGNTCVRIYQVSCNKNMKLASGKIGCRICKVFSVLYDKDFDIESEDTINLFLSLEIDENTIDYFYRDRSEVIISEMPIDSEGYERLYYLLENMYDDPDYKNYDNSFNYDIYEDLKEQYKGHTNL